jgi:hypothetical protein
MKKNAELRKQAIRLSWQNRGILWEIFLLVAVINMLWCAVRTFLIGNDLLEIVFQFVTSPVMVLGLFHLLLCLTRGVKVRWSILFDFVKSPKVVSKALIVGAIWQFPYVVFFYLKNAGTPVIHQKEVAIFVLVVTLAAGLLALWIMLRLFLLPYLFVAMPHEGMSAMMKSSFRIMKKHVRHLLWYGLTVCGWALALFIGIILLVPSFFVGSMYGQFVSQLIAILFFALFGPYCGLALAGYANEMLSSVSEEIGAAR